jgi:hypothetical protein
MASFLRQVLRTMAIGIAALLVRQSVLPKSSCPALCRAPTSLKQRGTKDVDGRDVCAKTRFALLPGHDEEKA